MLKALWNGRSGLYSNQNRIDTISNNIANIDTNGYKKCDVGFEDIFYEKLDRLGTPITTANKEGLIVGSGSRADKLIRNFTQGFLVDTSKADDLAIEGEGFFRLTDGQGNYFYTRDGGFNVDKYGNFVHCSGLILDIEGYDSTKLSSDFKIAEDGTLTSNSNNIGKINLYSFKNLDEMQSYGNNIYKAENPKTIVNGKIKQGYLEKSNVDLGKELTDMIVTQRAFELNSKALKAADEMWQIANNIRSK
ncbi:flagellar basal body rod protein FlgG [Fervidicella metallireducens AeB]|uniref:Flagellar basal body rod protein FlgG n=1 Tax=Fervidicella metallireducens AeB TaxID=1403537 RepID=A0A017RWM7_9CLOT|nr:flagellar hook-basal body complex protein [Fervidicella metallireducens]EYE88814.1 flagellar basal body rod protein FlgG [Fervidicella metallireducens AeB]